MRGLLGKVVAAVLWLLLGGVRHALAQDTPGPITLHLSANLIQLPALVLSTTRHSIRRIPEKDFYVSLDSGPEFRVTHARAEGDDPITMALVLDAGGQADSLEQGFGNLFAEFAVSSLTTRDHVSIYARGCSLLETAEDLPVDGPKLKAAVDQARILTGEELENGGRSGCKRPVGLWDALIAAVQGIEGFPGRRVLLVVSDGVDGSSTRSWNEMQLYAQSRGVAVFALAPRTAAAVIDAKRSPRMYLTLHTYENPFNAVCELTGGMILISDQRHAGQRLREFVRLLRERYILEFPRPSNAQSGRHGILVTVKHRDLFIRPAGTSVPIPDTKAPVDPNSLPSDPSHAPLLGTRRILPQSPRL